MSAVGVQRAAHLVVDLSGHGYGHLAQTAPLLNRLAQMRPDLRITLRTPLPASVLELRLRCRYRLEPRAMDFGIVMADAVSADVAASVAAYDSFHDGWDARVEREARALQRLETDLMLANVPYLSLAAAARAGVPAVALCSLNWLDLYRDLCLPHAPRGARIVAEMQAAYGGARLFLAPEPSMPMPALEGVVDRLPIGPLAQPGRRRREELCRRLGVDPSRSLVLVTMGGVDYALECAAWPPSPNLHFIVPGAQQRGDWTGIERLEWPFPDLAASVDALLTKPGYGTFVEAACAGQAVAYLRRRRWLEQDALISWLHVNARCMEVEQGALHRGDFFADLERCLSGAAPKPPRPSGVEQAAELLDGLLRAQVPSHSG